MKKDDLNHQDMEALEWKPKTVENEKQCGTPSQGKPPFWGYGFSME